MLIKNLYFRSPGEGQKQTLSLITPKDANYLQSIGFNLFIENNHASNYSDQSYQLSGCTLVPRCNWTSFTSDLIVFGATPIPLAEFPLSQIHIAPFPQDGDKKNIAAIMRRFLIGGGKIFELSTFLGAPVEDFILNQLTADGPPPPPSSTPNNLEELSHNLVQRTIQLLVADNSKLFANLSDFYNRLINSFQKEQMTLWSNISVNKREEMRVPFHAKVKISLVEGESFEGYTKNISVSGVFVNTDHSVKLLKKCTLDILWDYAGKNIPFIVEGEISRSTPEGLGIYFNNMDMDTFYFLKDLVKYSSPE